MICSSLNRLRFIVRLLWSDGLYSILEEFSGLSQASCRPGVRLGEPVRCLSPLVPKLAASKLVHFSIITCAREA